MNLEVLESLAVAALAHSTDNNATVRFSVPTKKLQAYQGLDATVIGNDGDMSLLSVEARKLRDAITQFKLKFLGKLAEK